MKTQSGAGRAGTTRAPAKEKKTKPVPAARRRAAATALSHLRKICLALPEVYEKEAWQTRTFRVEGGKMFAMFVGGHHGDERIAVWCRAPIGAQEVLVVADPGRFFRPPYVGANGWLGVVLDGGVDWREVAGILADGHRLAAPRRRRAERARR